MVYTVPHFIGGEKIINTEVNGAPIYNPALGEVIGEVNFASQDICNQAVGSAKQAWYKWQEFPPSKRVKILFRFRELLVKNLDFLAKVVTSEHGKTLDDAKGSILRAIELVEHHCALIAQLQGKLSFEASRDIDCYTFPQALGVCAGVSPFNFPVMVPIWMMIPAIACGNSFILKPSELDPSAPVHLIELLEEAGLPKGVASCVQGDKNTVDILLNHPDIASFTAVASTPVAEKIFNTAISLGKRAHTFGGAKNHAVILPDADVEQAAVAIVGAAYGSAGERCMAISVVVVVGDDFANKFIAQLLPLIKAIRVGPGDESQTDMGPLITKIHREKVIAAIDQGVAEGAQLLVDGRNFKHQQYPTGFYLGPCLFDAVSESMSIYQQEIFGPVLVLMRVNSFAEALDLINRNQYGNGTAIFTSDGYYARRFMQEVQVGMVGVNVPIPVPIAQHSFGGWKRSCFGNANMHGLESINFYTRRKTVTVKWPRTEIKESAFIMPNH